MHAGSYPIVAANIVPHADGMESLLSINGVARALSLVGVPVIAGTALLAVVFLTGTAERILNYFEDRPRRSAPD